MDFTDDENLFNALNAKINVARVGESNGRHGITLDSLSKKCLISPEAEMRTVQKTTLRGIRKIIHQSLSRRFKNNNRLLRYSRLQHNVFTDKMQAGTVSRRVNIYDHVYLNEFGWSRAHPIKKKGDAHETFSLFFK